MPEERAGVITFKGNPMTLVGPDIKEGDSAPEATLTGTDLSPVSPLASSEGKTRLLIAVPSLDTSVCSLETKRFSDAVKDLGDSVAVYTISADLPFAQKRWCGAEGVENIQMLSDYRGREFARAWGLLIKELDLLARAVYVVSPEGKVTYRQIVPEVASEPDYDAAVQAARAAA